MLHFQVSCAMLSELIELHNASYAVVFFCLEPQHLPCRYGNLAEI